MHVFDSSVWIYAITRTCDEATELVESVLDGRIRVAVDPYVFEEVIAGIDRAGSDRRAIDDAQTHFAEIVHGSPAVDAPSHRAVAEMRLDAIRTDDRTRMLGRTWGIQAKDVPIVMLADDQPSEPTIVYTSDREFSRFDPTEYGIDGIALRYVDCSNGTR